MSKNKSDQQNISDNYELSVADFDKSRFHNLNENEIEQLQENNNRCQDWKKIYVTDTFNPDLIINCEFYGINFIDDLVPGELTFDGVQLPVGLNNCTVYSSILGKNIALKNILYIKNFYIGDNSFLFNIGQLSCSENAKFGCGYIFKGEDEDDRFWLEISNENGGRKILPNKNILPADAFLWSRFKDRTDLNNSLIALTDNLVQSNTSKGFIGENSKIKNTSEISDAFIGSSCQIDGANKLHNLSIHSSKEESTFIGEDVDIQNAIIGYANKIFMGPKCENIVSGRNVKIELGARVLNTFISDNSTIACCEVLNNLVFPFHEQHHNNSFLIATTILGQSNIAAGATIGSNHNSRAADGEILAGRGFWPGLESNYKHNSYFSSFTLIAKGSYETELNIELPFSLVSKDADTGTLQIFPGFWFRYNMYALARNSWKFKNRDKRKVKLQKIEMDYLAPDTALEMLKGIEIIQKAIKETTGQQIVIDENYDPKKELKNIFLENAAPKLKSLIIKPLQGLWLYKIMLDLYAAHELVKYINLNNAFDIKAIKMNSDDWINIGGQLVTQKDIETLITDIESKKIKSWSEIHTQYERLWEQYPQQRLANAMYCWLASDQKKINDLTTEDIQNLFKHAIKTSELLVNWTTEARKKDYTNPFRKITYRNQEEMDAVLGRLEDNSFIDEMANQHRTFVEDIKLAVTKL